MRKRLYGTAGTKSSICEECSQLARKNSVSRARARGLGCVSVSLLVPVRAGRPQEFPMNASVFAQLVVLGMIWGASFMFQRITVPVIGAGMTGAGRMIFAALTLLAVLA